MSKLHQYIKQLHSKTYQQFFQTDQIQSTCVCHYSFCYDKKFSDYFKFFFRFSKCFNPAKLFCQGASPVLDRKDTNQTSEHQTCENLIIPQEQRWSSSIITRLISQNGFETVKQVKQWSKLQQIVVSVVVFSLLKSCIRINPIYQLGQNYTSAKLLHHQKIKYASQTKGFQEIKQNYLFNGLGDYSQIKNKSFKHTMNLINNPIQMDLFSLEDLETTQSEYDQCDDTLSLMSESVVVSSLDGSTEQTSTVSI
eukprot:TRINITY_DN3604_c0_g1_i4.p1 TRINITY_DN3604_c0_g1~~TRINITY_DN3604_c0_g1_i4.p1  ORF type:complete len:252 (-),score=26.98 TRINITY_DN3604_c0_g1_i4:195-950(-)